MQSLTERVGLRIDEPKARVALVRKAVQDGERRLEEQSKALVASSELRARSEQRAEDAHRTLQERTEARQQFVHALEQFWATGLLAVALPELDATPLP